MQSTIGKYTSRHLFPYGGLNNDNDESSGVSNHLIVTVHLLQILSMTPRICQNPL